MFICRHKCIDVFVCVHMFVRMRLYTGGYIYICKVMCECTFSQTITKFEKNKKLKVRMIDIWIILIL